MASPWRVSIRKSQDPLTHLDYSATPKRKEAAGKLPMDASLRSSSCSQEVLQCSPATLALKKKYSDIRWHPVHRSSNTSVEHNRQGETVKRPKDRIGVETNGCPSLDGRGSDSFEFRPHSLAPASNQPTELQDNPERAHSMAVDGAAEMVEMDVDISPVKHLDASTSDLHAIAMRDGRRSSLRLSYDPEPLKFGSPY